MHKPVDRQPSHEETNHDNDAAALLAWIALGEQGIAEDPLSFDDVIALLSKM
ncbi:hypothetical protein KL866_14630 [Alteromonas sp. ALT199]|uniref:hypothetical protein n=1 Tax=unclassified Alteromonas TaxID=2614992 RepID=UPI001BE7649C|nr:hypothetical protein [Alteromonas sp. ALT199]MBT3136310.1 hypothetical protein [Alteromonas sp. ALT199]